MVLKLIFGEFGSGKTISCVDEVQRICKEFPKCVLITNTAISGISNKTIIFETSDELMKILLSIDFDNNNFGYLVFIDEIHVALQYMLTSVYAEDFLTFISQLRKIHVYILGTSQLYSKNKKALRDYMRQNGQFVFCFKLLPGLTLQKYVDMSTCKEDAKNQLVYNVTHVVRFYHTPELYQSYDTNSVIKEIKNIGKKGVDSLGN